MTPRLVVGITGASGAVYGVRLLQRARLLGIETHAVITPAGVLNAHHGFGDNLLTRAADVTLKERRRLILLVRETPFNLAHLRNMTAVTEMGGIIFPPLPAFYNKPASIDEMVDDTVERVLALAGIALAAPKAWQGLR
jgi:flavin prenyltransferase